MRKKFRMLQQPIQYQREIIVAEGRQYNVAEGRQQAYY